MGVGSGAGGVGGSAGGGAEGIVPIPSVGCCGEVGHVSEGVGGGEAGVGSAAVLSGMTGGEAKLSSGGKGVGFERVGSGDQGEAGVGVDPGKLSAGGVAAGGQSVGLEAGADAGIGSGIVKDGSEVAGQLGIDLLDVVSDGDTTGSGGIGIGAG